MAISVGDVFGKMTVIAVSGAGAKGHRRWLCRCECGAEKPVFETALTQGRTKSCGCLAFQESARSIAAEAGRRYGMLTVIGFSHRKGNECLVHCLCDCGANITTDLYRVRRGKAASCGCLCSQKTHGMCYTTEYKSWSCMIQRCLNPRNAAYPEYGGRGIGICGEWTGPGGFEAFFRDMGPKPAKSYSIDRINNELGYSPQNCRWATPREQNRNKRNAVMLTLRGETLNVSEWARRFQISPKRIYQWVNRYKFSIEKIESILQSLDL